MSAARKYVYLYTGGAAVPKDVTHVRVDESVTIISDRAFMDCQIIFSAMVTIYHIGRVDNTHLLSEGF